MGTGKEKLTGPRACHTVKLLRESLPPRGWAFFILNLHRNIEHATETVSSIMALR